MHKHIFFWQSTIQHISRSSLTSHMVMKGLFYWPPPPHPLKAYGQLRHTVLNKCVASVCVMYEHLCEHGFLCVSARPCMYMTCLSLKKIFFSICVGPLFYVFGVDLNNTHFFLN